MGENIPKKPTCTGCDGHAGVGRSIEEGLEGAIGCAGRAVSARNLTGSALDIAECTLAVACILIIASGAVGVADVRQIEQGSSTASAVIDSDGAG